MHRAGVFTVIAIGAAGLIGACQGQARPAAAVVPAAAPAQVGAAIAVQPATPPQPPAPPVRQPDPLPTEPPFPTPTQIASATPTASPAPAAQPVAATAPSPSAGCQFVLGFATLRDVLGPDRVGACLEEVRQIPGNGNAEQKTANGILVYRAIDGRVLFSDQARTWISGPEGLSERPNTMRLPFEGDRQLIEALRDGGYIIYFRHGPTDRGQQDTDPNNLANCATQRNLTDPGRAQARKIGEAVRALSIPVGSVLSSEYCRALEYARLSFGGSKTEASLVLPDPLTQAERDQNTAALQGLLATLPAAGTNTVLVSHSPNIKTAAGVDLPAEGGAVILRPDAQGKPTVVARMLPDEWSTLAEAMAAR